MLTVLVQLLPEAVEGPAIFVCTFVLVKPWLAQTFCWRGVASLVRPQPLGHALAGLTLYWLRYRMLHSANRPRFSQRTLDLVLS